MMMTFTPNEAIALQEEGFFAAWMKDVREGDMIAIPPVSRFSEINDEVQWVYVTRLRNVKASSSVVTVIGITLDGYEIHHAYGDSYPVSILRLDP